jgi:cell division protein FtsA
LGRKDRFFAALDIGTTKTCAIIAEPRETGLRFLGHGCVESHGGRRGQIVNLDLAVGCIRQAIESAESEAGSPIESALIGVAGSHVRGLNSRGGISLGRRPRDVRREDVHDAVQAARGVTLPGDREILHVLPQEFALDAQDGIRDPIGMVGQRLEADVHIVTSSATAAQNVVTAVNRAGVMVSDTVLEPLAAAEACLTQDERELGCCLLDFGGGTTEIIVYTGGVVRHTAAFPVGGDHFTNDLAVGLRTPMPEAERVKYEHASAWKGTFPDGTEIEVAGIGGRPPRTVLSRTIAEIIQARAQELLLLIRDDLRRAGLDSQIPAGFVFTGGAGRLRGFLELAEQIFSLPVRLAGPRPLESMPDDLAEPEFSTAVGLLLYGARMRRISSQGGHGGRGWWGNFFGS